MDCSADSSIFRGRGGLGDVLKVAFPLIVASLVHAVNLFTDRMMLAAYSPLAMAAAFSAGLTTFTLSCIFLGTVGYAGAFADIVTFSGSSPISLYPWKNKPNLNKLSFTIYLLSLSLYPFSR